MLAKSNFTINGNPEVVRDTETRNTFRVIILGEYPIHSWVDGNSRLREMVKVL